MLSRISLPSTIARALDCRPETTLTIVQGLLNRKGLGKGTTALLLQNQGGVAGTVPQRISYQHSKRLEKSIFPREQRILSVAIMPTAESRQAPPPSRSSRPRGATPPWTKRRRSGS